MNVQQAAYEAIQNMSNYSHYTKPLETNIW